MKLNPSQQAVVAARGERILVLAGAGTGKTATSVHWVADLIKGGSRRSQILMITFTRKAANEMAKRIESLISHVPKFGSGDKITVGTYHAVASILLRSEGEAFGLSNNTFSTLDESECQSIWKSALKQCGIEGKHALFVPNRLQQMLSFSRNTGRPMSETLDENFGKHAKKMAKVVRTYEELKRAANVVDYDDLLVLWLERMRKDPAYAAKLRERWHYVLVDEMQDNNQLNQALLDALNPKTLLVVGDANQSIYSFRGSDVSLIRQFATKRSDTVTYRLESNYRSGQGILDLANAVVAGTPSALVLQSARTLEAAIDYHCYGGTGAEANGVIQWMQARIKAGAKPCENAVLARSSKALSELEVALNANRIRYKKYGGQTIADAAEVKDFISFLRVSHNLQDKIALLRALMQFPGIGEGTAAKVISEHQGSLFGADYWPEPAKELPLWIEEIQSVKELPSKARILEDRIKPLILHNYPKDGEERLGTLHALVTSTEGEALANTSLVDFLDGFALSRSTNDFHPDDAVVLSTIHSSKGLEWDGVCLIGSGSCQIPHPRSLDSGDIEEERRLFYVAVTRARQDLLLTFPKATDRGQDQKPSPFVPPETKWKFFFS
ncbi:DNA helicase-2 / ATP-dependent DNA helicase PcrA [Verrucomicrobium sp. GAS474]|uniref:ATP-dependent helicase n=1 Tax=Verrucomicrobium sp. GAS474 TaxID=1882831 RepID=UPI00087B48AC|nr:ATP-dependent helicase [Verrucomicrobium sp. GAS474]SDU20681.1 DNA helicase-2 / ATP-dependent DNA helicase PcrA [Verrucomicrobium sp. GAS474]